MKSRSCIFLFFVFFPAIIFCQDVGDIVKTSFTDYVANNYTEKIYVHTDKSVYSTGEIIWFKVYNTDRLLNRPSVLSKICYVELLADSVPAMQAKIALDSGAGTGSLVLPASIQSGNYKLRAYTNWMKNFDALFYFEKQITIINLSKKPHWSNTDTSQTYHVQFFPEGGNLVNGIETKIAFKISDRYGRPITAKGTITDENNLVLANFQSSNLGTGHFNFRATGLHSYKAIVQTTEGRFFNDSFVQVYNSGWSMQVSDESNVYKITVRTNEAGANAVYLFAETHGLFKLARKQVFNNNETMFLVKKTDVGDGITHFTVFNDAKQPVCERLVFQKPTNLLTTELIVSKQNAGIRNKIDVSILTKNANHEGVVTDMSVSVFLTDALQQNNDESISAYVWLSSELKGKVESPSFYFSDSPDAAVALDDLLLTQGWRRFKWENVLQNKKPSFSYLPEHEGHLISAKFENKSGGTNSNTLAYLSVPGDNFRFVNTRSDANGNLLFHVPFFYGPHEIVLQNNTGNNDWRIEVNNAFSEKYSTFQMPPFNVTEQLQKEILLRNLHAQTQQYFSAKRKYNFFYPSYTDTTSFFGNASKTYYTDDYTRFPTTEEVMREYVKEVRVRKEHDHFYYNVLNLSDKRFFSDSPLVIIDGVPVFNTDRIMAMDPLKIRKIDVLTRSHFSGPTMYNGIVSYSTYAGDLDGYDLDPNAVVMEYEGLQLQREFYSPSYDNDAALKSRTPDFRNVLYWSPDIRTINGKADFSFYTSDVPGTYTIVVQGITAKGEIGTAIQKFIVR